MAAIPSPALRLVRVGGAMTLKPVFVRVSGAWQQFDVTGKLYLSPASGSFAVNDTVDIAIREDSFSRAVNTVQANLTYPSTLLQFVSADTTGGAFTTTVQNTGGSGTVQFAVGILGGSISGDQLVGTLHFKALAAGSANVAFSSGCGIATASGNTDICNQTPGGSYTIS